MCIFKYIHAYDFRNRMSTVEPVSDACKVVCLREMYNQLFAAVHLTMNTAAVAGL